MFELRLHGRGGQGAVLAAGILAQALVEEGKYAVAIPAFGFERRGAPVVSFLRCSDREIRQLTNIYHPNCIVCIDPTVHRSVDIFAGVAPDATLVQTTQRPLGELAIPDSIATVGLCDAVSIAMEVFRRPITNTVMLGALARTTGIVRLESLVRALEESDFRDAGLQQNLTALRRGHDETVVHRIERRVAA